MLRWCGLLILLLSGCGRNLGTLPDDYGERRGPGLNGLGVLSEMFRQTGSRVVTWKRLSPKVQKQDTVVWAPTNYGLPSDEQIAFFDDWLQSDYGRTLVLINRDYDAAVGHWRTLLDGATGQQAIEIRRRLAIAEAELSQRIHQTPNQECDWYSVEADSNSGWAIDFEGEWAEIIDSRNARIYSGLKMSFDPLDEDYMVEHLLIENDRPVISRIVCDRWYDDCQVIVVSNGSTLFNQPLVNHENRKLAASLVDACNNPNRAMILEGSTDGVEVRNTDASAPMMLQAFTVWPINFLMIHATLLGILFCISVFPIFGRPRELASASVSDFGKHVRAYGEMLQQVSGTEYVRERLRQYRAVSPHDNQNS